MERISTTRVLSKQQGAGPNKKVGKITSASNASNENEQEMQDSYTANTDRNQKKSQKESKDINQVPKSSRKKTTQETSARDTEPASSSSASTSSGSKNVSSVQNRDNDTLSRKRKSDSKSGSRTSKAPKVSDLSSEIRLDDVEIIEKDYTLKRSKVRPFLNGLGVSISFDVALSEAIIQKEMELVDLQYLLNDIFSNILKLLRQNAQPKSLVKIVIFQDELDSPLIIPLMALVKLRPNLILEKIEHLSQ